MELRHDYTDEIVDQNGVGVQCARQTLLTLNSFRSFMFCHPSNAHCLPRVSSLHFLLLPLCVCRSCQIDLETRAI